MSLEEYKGVYVFAQQIDNHITEITYELMGKAIELAKDLDTEVVAVLCGSEIENKVFHLKEHGADKIILIDDPELKEYRTEPYAHALSELNEPRYMTPGGIFDAYDAEITVWGRDDLTTLKDENIGLKGSPTQIAKASDKVAKGAGEKVTPETAADAADYILGKLAEKFVI